MANELDGEPINSVPQATDLAPKNIKDEPSDGIRYILVLGPRGSGKTTFINQANFNIRSHQPVARGPELCTKEFTTSQKFRAHNQEFAFIDSPGFDNKVMCDEAIFVGIMDHLYKNPQRPIKLTGIIYIHPEGDELGSRTLWRNLDMLVALIGGTYRARVTIIIKSQSKNDASMDEKALASTFSRAQTPFNHFYEGVQHHIRGFREWTWKTIKRTLYPYTLMQPLHFDAQQKFFEGTWNNGQLIPELRNLLPPTYARNCLCDQPSHEDGSTTITSAPTTNAQEQHQETKRLIASDSLSADETSVYAQPTLQEQDPSSQNEPEGDSVRQEDIAAMKERLKKAQDDYASLCEHLQVQDNVEESRVAEHLDDINHLIEKIGLLVSQHINEAQSETNFLNSLKDVPQLEVLLIRFGHIEGRSSLIRSLGGKYMDPGDFFDYAVRATLCQKLDENLFRLFHPSTVGGDDVTEIYNQIRRREPQLVAGRWRRDAFKAMDHLAAMKLGEAKMTKLHEILADSLDDLLKCCFTPSFETKITEEERKHLIQLANKAESLNRLVKGSVVYIGDFHPVIFSYGSAFQDSRMSELQTNQRTKRTDHPETILATTALGLVKRYAFGGDQASEETVVRKATVVSERVCTFL